MQKASFETLVKEMRKVVLSKEDVVFVDVMEERIKQDQQYGGPAHDDTHTPEEWIILLDKYIDRAEAKWAAMGSSDVQIAHTYTAAYREALIKIAAVAIAAVESLDRKVGAKDVGIIC